MEPRLPKIRDTIEPIGPHKARRLANLIRAYADRANQAAGYLNRMADAQTLFKDAAAAMGCESRARTLEVLRDLSVRTRWLMGQVSAGRRKR